MPATSRKRGTFQFSFAQRPRRFAFEIENDKIFPGVERLAEMIIAVDANLGRAGMLFENALFLRENFFLRAEDFFGFVAEVLGQYRQVSFATAQTCGATMRACFDKRNAAPSR